MKTKKVEVALPLSIYDDLQQIADASSWSLEKVIVQTIKSGMPPSLGKVPADFHTELIELNGLSDQELMRIVEGEPPATALDEQRKKADFVALRRTYALSLLKWRGHPVPMPYEFS